MIYEWEMDLSINNWVGLMGLTPHSHISLLTWQSKFKTLIKFHMSSERKSFLIGHTRVLIIKCADELHTYSERRNWSWQRMIVIFLLLRNVRKLFNFSHASHPSYRRGIIEMKTFFSLLLLKQVCEKRKQSVKKFLQIVLSAAQESQSSYTRNVINQMKGLFFLLMWNFVLKRGLIKRQ